MSSLTQSADHPALVSVGPGVQLFVQDWGTGKPIVMVAGYPYGHQTWEYNVGPLLDSGHRVIACDLRGFGMSTKTYAGCDYETWAADLAGLLEALDLRDVTLVGHSMGAAVCAQLVGGGNEPRVGRLALIAAPAPFLGASPRTAKMINDWIKQLKGDRPAFLDLLAGIIFFNPSPQLTAWAVSDGMQASMRACIRGLEEMRDRDLGRQLAGIHVPTRLFWGAHDNIVGRDLIDAQLAAIKNSDLAVFKTSGHGVHYDERDLLNMALADFVAGKPVSRG